MVELQPTYSSADAQQANILLDEQKVVVVNLPLSGGDAAFDNRK